MICISSEGSQNAKQGNIHAGIIFLKNHKHELHHIKRSEIN